MHITQANHLQSPWKPSSNHKHKELFMDFEVLNGKLDYNQPYIQSFRDVRFGIYVASKGWTFGRVAIHIRHVPSINGFLTRLRVALLHSSFPGDWIRHFDSFKSVLCVRYFGQAAGTWRTMMLRVCFFRGSIRVLTCF